MNKVRSLLDVLGQWKVWYLTAGVALVLSSAIQMLEPKVIQLLIDKLNSHFGVENTHTRDFIANILHNLIPDQAATGIAHFVFLLAIAVVVLAMSRVLLQFFSTAAVSHSTERSIENLRNRLFHKIHALSLASLVNFPKGEMTQRCTGDVDTVKRFLHTEITELIRITAMFFAALSLMLIVHPIYALICIAMVPFIFITSYLFFKRESLVWHEHEEEQDKLTGIIQENLNGIRNVQAYVQEDAQINTFQEQNLRKRTVAIKHVRLHQYFWSFSDFLIAIQITLAVFAGTYYTIHQEISLGEFVSFFFYVGVVTWPLRQVGRIVSQLGMATVARERIEQLLQAEEETYDGILLDSQNCPPRIVFKNVSFAYPAKPENAVLNDFSLEIEPGQRIAIMGPAGSGKSVLFDLLLGFYKPQQGIILINDIPVEQYNLHALRKQLGWVRQQAYIYSDTLHNNIRFGSQDLAGDHVVKHAEMAMLHPFVTTLQDGYNTLTGEKGVNLSGGQKQRLAIARVLESDPSVFILDDSLSAVDTETEQSIIEKLSAWFSGKTVILIAHRLTSLQFADRFVIMKHGRIVESGTHDELIALKGYYSRIYQLQANLEIMVARDINNL
jgi:ATP-binding cassette, subfamily B, bacterial